MEQPPLSSEQLRKTSVELLAEKYANAFITFWKQLLPTLTEEQIDSLNIPDDFGNVDIEQYYKMVHLFTLPFDTEPGYLRSLANFEIYKSNLAPRSAEFNLLTNPNEPELLIHAFSIYYDEPYEKSIKRSQYTANDPIYENSIAEHASLEAFQQENPDLFWRLILTRNLKHYEDICWIENHSKKLIEEIKSESSWYDEVEEIDLIEMHTHRAELHRASRHMIEQLVADGIQPLSPEEYSEFVNKYLTQLIKENDDRLNPYSSEKDLPKMPGEITVERFLANKVIEKYTI